MVAICWSVTKNSHRLFLPDRSASEFDSSSLMKLRIKKCLEIYLRTCCIYIWKPSIHVTFCFWACNFQCLILTCVLRMFTSTSSLPSFACVLMLWALLSPPLVQACQGDELPRDMVHGWLKRRILDSLGMDEPPLPVLQLPTQQAVNKVVHHVALRMTRETRVERRHHQESSQVILFPSSGELVSCPLAIWKKIMFNINKILGSLYDCVLI